MKKVFVLVSLLACAFPVFSQVNLNEVNFNRIPFKKVRAYIHTQILHNIKSSDDLVPSYEKDVVPESLSDQTCSYKLPVSVETAWEAYSLAMPDKAWNGRKARLGMLVNKPANKVYYPGDRCEAIDTGQVVYLNLRVLKGVLNLGMAFEIINIDENNHILEFSYIKGNKSLGKQQLFFAENEDGTTELTHVSYFKSESGFRDKFLYPYFHKRFTNEFHRNMSRSIVSEQNSSPDNLTYIK